MVTLDLWSRFANAIASIISNLSPDFPTSDSQLYAIASRLPIPDFPTPDSRFPIPDSRFPY
ncbi:MAG: hypothetical protein F6J98_10715 [Moorea sp. SIO4G2]|nr:hypothetical protein [Moorena sp. SIO4G2]